MHSSSNLENLFIHLRAHSDYSLGKSTNKIQALVKESLKYKMPALCLADYGNLFGSLEFSMECVKNGIKPLIGCIMNVLLPQQFALQSGNQLNLHDFFIIAKNKSGYRNLLYLVSHSFLDTKGDVTSYITLEQLFQKSDGIVLLSPSTTQGITSKLFNSGKTAQLEELVVSLSKQFEDNFFLEFIRNSDKIDFALEDICLDLAYKHNIPIVASNPISYLTPELMVAQDVLLCITESKYLLEDTRPKAGIHNYFKSPSDMVKLFSDLPEAIENTALIAMKCSAMAEERSPMLPKFTTKSQDISGNTKSISEAEALRNAAKTGLENRISDITDSKEREEYFLRLEFELEVINKMNFPGYFLIVSDFIKWSKSQRIPVGPGRGSGVGSIVAWALEITDLDPIKFGLLFERFLNPERVSMPDFDIDFCQERRDEVIWYVQQKYGNERVAQIITFGKLQARAVLRDVGRVMQLPYGLIDKISKSVPHNPANPITLSEAIKLDKELQAQRANDPDIDKLLSISLQLEGINRHVSTHAAGIVISDRPIIELAPLYQDANSMMQAVQYSLKYAESAGLIKFDFLGLKTLTVISKTCSLINESIMQENKSKDNPKFFDINSIGLDDKKTYQMLSRGETIGVFQFEGVGMRGSIKNLKPDCIGDLMALASLYRPGPMDNIPSYIKRKHGIEKVSHIHKKLEELLSETYGIIIYQEQVMEIAKILAGYSLGQADLLRRAIGKKNKAEMERLREGFVTGAVKGGIEKQQAQEIFGLVEKFASYGFNKSHAAAYSVISYQTAYLKAHYPLQFFTASINLEIHDSDKISMFCSDARHFKIKILPPDINSSGAYCKIEGDAIRFGLAGIKNVGISAMEILVKERQENGPFSDIFDVLERCSHNTINKRAIENLAKAGALNSVADNKKRIFSNVDTLIKYSNFYHNNSSSQIDLFAQDGKQYCLRPELQLCQDWDQKEGSKMEFEALGFYLSSHPLSEHKVKLQKAKVITSDLIERLADKNAAKMNIAGIVINKKIRSTPRGKFAFLQLSDPNGIIDVSIFNEQILYENADLIAEGRAVFCETETRKDAAGIKIIIEKIHDLDDYLSKVNSSFNVYVSKIEVIDKIANEACESGVPINIIAKLKYSDGTDQISDKTFQIYFSHQKQIFVKKESLEKMKNIDGIELVEV